MKQEKSKAVSIPFIGGKDVMPITGYFGPYPHDYEHLPDYFTEEVFHMIADAGINLMVYSAANYAEHPELVEKNLEFGEKYGVGVFVTDDSVIEKRHQETITAEEVKKAMEPYSHRKAFCGMYVVDEPEEKGYSWGEGKKALCTYERISEVLQKELDCLCYINLLPVMIMEDYQAKYERYVKDVLDTMRPKVAMWDYYPFDEWREGRMDLYLYNMDLIRREALERGIPFWAFIQAGSQWNDGWKKFDSITPYFPNEEQFDWIVNTSLAFGAQGIQYFPLVQPIQFTLTTTDEGDFERNGILGGMCNKTQWYYYAQRMNKHIAAIDEVLMNCVSEGIIVSGEQAKKDVAMTTCVIEAGSFNELQSVAGDAMVGCFDYQGKTALYVVNYNYESAQDITLQFDGAQNLKMVRNARDSYETGNTLTLNMSAGEGVLLVIE